MPQSSKSRAVQGVQEFNTLTERPASPKIVYFFDPHPRGSRLWGRVRLIACAVGDLLLSPYHRFPTSGGACGILKEGAGIRKSQISVGFALYVATRTIHASQPIAAA